MKIVSIVDARPQFIKCAPLFRELRKVNDFMPVHMYNLSVEALKRIGKTLTGSKVAILGWVFNSDDARNPRLRRTGICWLMPGARWMCMIPMCRSIRAWIFSMSVPCCEGG